MDRVSLIPLLIHGSDTHVFLHPQFLFFVSIVMSIYNRSLSRRSIAICKHFHLIKTKIRIDIAIRDYFYRGKVVLPPSSCLLVRTNISIPNRWAGWPDSLRTLFSHPHTYTHTQTHPYAYIYLHFRPFNLVKGKRSPTIAIIYNHNLHHMYS